VLVGILSWAATRPICRKNFRITGTSPVQAALHFDSEAAHPSPIQSSDPAIDGQETKNSRRRGDGLKGSEELVKVAMNVMVCGLKRAELAIIQVQKGEFKASVL
jgi:hypothetical protein